MPQREIWVDWVHLTFCRHIRPLFLRPSIFLKLRELSVCSFFILTSFALFFISHLPFYIHVLVFSHFLVSIHATLSSLIPFSIHATSCFSHRSFLFVGGLCAITIPFTHATFCYSTGPSCWWAAAPCRATAPSWTPSSSLTRRPRSSWPGRPGWPPPGYLPSRPSSRAATKYSASPRENLNSVFDAW